MSISLSDSRSAEFIPRENRWLRNEFRAPINAMHKGIHNRGYLPHWDFADSVQAITFRLDDSLPVEVVRRWKRELNEMLASPDQEESRRAQAELRRRIADYEDAGHGECLLAIPDHAAIVQAQLKKHHGSKYKLIEWCIMPNHVHVLMKLLDDTPLHEIVKRWKAVSAVQINRLTGRCGSLWMVDYHDRYIRDMDHFLNARAYIRMNPVKAGLCKEPEDWPWSSVGIHWIAECIPPETGGLAE
jgi:REP element-mobilizing transposase RayT